jgi:hypothetical protein
VRSGDSVSVTLPRSPHSRVGHPVWRLTPGTWPAAANGTEGAAHRGRPNGGAGLRPAGTGDFHPEVTVQVRGVRDRADRVVHVLNAQQKPVGRGIDLV